jgi:uncharacterized protein YaaN involved in tellurite resistance
MSNKKEDKTKLYHKFHQLQKRLKRSKDNPGHSMDKEKIRMKILQKLKDRINGTNKK